MLRNSFCLALLLSALSCGDAHALEPHTRDGWVVGLGIGYGPASLHLGPALGNDDSGWIGGTSSQLRVGHALHPHFTFGLEHKAWLDEQGFGTTKVRASIQNVAATVTWFPGSERNDTGGIYLKGGVGFAHGRFTVFDNAGSGVDTSSVEAHLDESGLGVMVAGGYEFRIVRSLAVGADVSVNYQRLRKLAFERNWFIPVTLGLNWYF